MNLIAGLYVLTLISNNGISELGKTPTGFQCAAAIGYVSRMLEVEEGGIAVSDFDVRSNDSFSINYSITDGSVVTLACDKEII